MSDSFPYPYGLGIMAVPFPTKDPKRAAENVFIGHGGQDWGSGGGGFYNHKWNFTFSYTLNTARGLNCDFKGNDFTAS